MAGVRAGSGLRKGRVPTSRAHPRWKAYPRATVSAWFAADSRTNVGDLEALDLNRRGVSGRRISVTLIGSLGSIELPAEAAVLYFRDGPDGNLRIQAYAKDIRRGPVLPEDHRSGDSSASAPP